MYPQAYELEFMPIKENIRQIICDNYRIIYKITDNEVQVLTILSCYKNISILS
jgi:mRNA-degrading endonuclease RelE of RelBE toxin-antitoxin system